jgi:uncharacterized membrane protein YkvA (DUF1232 family)
VHKPLTCGFVIPAGNPRQRSDLRFCDFGSVTAILNDPPTSTPRDTECDCSTNMWWQILIGVAAGLAVLYLTLLIMLWQASRRDPEAIGLCEALRLLPDVLRLLRRLTSDHNLPRGVRIRLILLIAYLASPIDLIPDFIPVLGYADDAIIVAIGLRSVIRHAGADAIEQHWPGSPEGLRIIQRLGGLS